MKTKPTLLLLTLPLTAPFAVRGASAESLAPVAAVAQNQVTPGTILAAQITEIAGTKDLNNASKRRQIASAVRLAVTTALTNVQSPDQAMQVLMELATEATKALPEYAALISDSLVGAALKVPVLVGRTDLMAKIRDTISDIADQAAAAEPAGADSPARRDKPEEEHEHHGRKDDVVVSPSK